MIFGFLLAITFDPLTYSGGTNPRWALLAIALPVLIWFSSPNHFSNSKLFGVLFLAWATISLIWTPNKWDGFGTLVLLTIIALSFVWGSRLTSLKPIFAGLAIGIAVSSIILLVPSLHSLPSIVAIYPHGLFGNRNMLAEIAVMAALGCLAYKNYWYIPGLLPAIFWQPLARDAIVAGIAGLCVWLWFKSKPAAYALAAIMILSGWAIIEYRPTSVIERLEVWKLLWDGITPLGWGLASIYTLAPYLPQTVWDTTLQRIDHAHNEFLEILFELGIPGLVLYFALVIDALRCSCKAGPLGNPAIVMVAFLAISSVAFPWHIPANAFVGALVLGHAARYGEPVRDYYYGERSFLRLWYQRHYALAYLRAINRRAAAVRPA